MASLNEAIKTSLRRGESRESIHHEFFGVDFDQFFPEHRTAATLDQIQGGVDRIGAIDGDIKWTLHLI